MPKYGVGAGVHLYQRPPHTGSLRQTSAAVRLVFQLQVISIPNETKPIGIDVTYPVVIEQNLYDINTSIKQHGR